MKTANRWKLLGVAMIAGLLCGPAPLQAQPTGEPATLADDAIPMTGDEPWNRGVSVEERQAARALFFEANRLFEIPLFAKAAEQYEAALRTWKHPAFYFNLALAQLNLGKEVAARESLERALAHGEAPLGPAQFREAQKQLREVMRQIGQLRVTCQTPGAEVTLDGATLFIGPGSYEGWVKATPHELTAKKSGFLSDARRVLVTPGRLQDIELTLVTLTQATDRSRRWAAWKPWAVVAAGGAIAAAGGALHGFSARSFEAYDDEFRSLPCAQGEHPTGCSEGEPSLPDLKLARRAQSVAMGGYVVGSALVAAGVVLLYLNRPRLPDGEIKRSPARGVAIVPTVSHDTLGIQMVVSQ